MSRLLGKSEMSDNIVFWQFHRQAAIILAALIISGDSRNARDVRSPSQSNVFHFHAVPPVVGGPLWQIPGLVMFICETWMKRDLHWNQ